MSDKSQIITLTTDWGTKDFFVGMVKGRLYSGIDNLQIVDIAHDLPPFDFLAASFVVKNACTGFPANTIHIVDISTDGALIAVKYNGQYYLCSDNGVPSSIFEDKYTCAVQLNDQPTEGFNTFPALTHLCPAAIQIANGTPIEEIGQPISSLKPCKLRTFISNDNEIIAYINYIDAYGNADLNILYDEFESLRQNRNFEIKVREYPITKICSNYFESSRINGRNTDLKIVTSATGHLQVAFLHDSAQRLLGLKVGDEIRITFQ